MSLGDQIKKARTQLGLSQNQLAKEAGVRQALLSELEAGKKTETTTGILKRLARRLGVSLDYLCEMEHFYDKRLRPPRADQ